MMNAFSQYAKKNILVRTVVSITRVLLQIAGFAIVHHN
jgi:hypothetical protein